MTIHPVEGYLGDMVQVGMCGRCFSPVMAESWTANVVQKTCQCWPSRYTNDVQIAPPIKRNRGES